MGVLVDVAELLTYARDFPLLEHLV